jgi:nitroreductase
VIEDLVRRSRTYRRFHEDRRIDEQTLRDLVDLGRLSPSAANLQPLKYKLSADPVMNRRIFPTLAWAGYLRPWMGPEEGERPSAYIVILGDTTISKNFGCDHGIAAQSIMLGACEKGIGGCMIGSIDRDSLRDVLDIPEHFEILLVLALGYPREKVVLEEIGPDGSIKYYRDENDVHHVPKRKLDDVILAD